MAENDPARRPRTSLKRAIFPRTTRPTGPSDRPHGPPTAEPMPVDIDAAIRTALASAPTSWWRARTSSAPTPDRLRQEPAPAAAGPLASYGGSGHRRHGARARPPLGRAARRRRSRAATATRLSSVFGSDFPNWRIGRQRHLPDPQPAGRRPTRRQAQDRQGPVARGLPAPRAAGGVRGPLRRARGRRRTSSGSSRPGPPARWPTQRLDAEEKKFAAGMSTNFLVTQAQRDLARGRGERDPGHRGLPQERDQLRARPRRRASGAPAAPCSS